MEQETYLKFSRVRTQAIVVILTLAAGSFQSTPASAQEAIVGHWTGVASREGADLPIELSFQNDGVETRGLITVRTMGALNFPLNKVSFEAPHLSFELRPDSGTFHFDGTVSDDSLTGSWNFFGFESHVSVRRTDAELMPYRREELSCRNGNVTLAATLLVPASQGQHPALVFLHGSGTVTRQANATVFRADHLPVEA